jgi:transposase
MVSYGENGSPLGAALMPDAHEPGRRDWRSPDELWERIVPLLPPRQPPPLGCHRPRVDARKAMEALFFGLRPGGQWHALHEPGSCARSAAHRRCQEWTAAAVFVALWAKGLVEDAALQGLAWAWLALDGALTKAPRGGEKGRPESSGARDNGPQAPRAHRRQGRAPRPRRRRRQAP